MMKGIFCQPLSWVALLALILAAATKADEAEPLEDLMSVDDLVAEGFSRSRVVMINEGHSGYRRCKRCRLVGRLLLPRAHAAGVRHFAAEALTVELARIANRERRLPEEAQGYLAQQDMRELLQAVLDLGWTLVAYEVAREAAEGMDLSSRDGINWREDRQARNLWRELSKLPDGSRMLVWCGNSHLRKKEGKIPSGPWLPMALRFWERSGIEPFSIDQTVTVNFGEQEGLDPQWRRHEAQLAESTSKTLGFLLPVDDPSGTDALVISLENSLE